jgi:hypothetical protein
MNHGAVSHARPGTLPWDDDDTLDEIGAECERELMTVTPPGVVRVLRIFPLDTSSVETILRQLVCM